MSVPARKPALSLTKAPVREHPVAPAAEPVGEEPTTGTVPVPEEAKPGPRGMGMLSVRIDLDLRHDVKRHAVDQDITVQTVIETALREYLANHAD